MNQKELMRIALKVSGIYVLVQAILHISGVVSALSMINSVKGSDLITVYSILFTPFFLLILGLILVFLKVSKTPVTIKIGSDLMAVGLAVAGVILSVLAMAQLPFVISNLIQFYTANSPMETIEFINPVEINPYAVGIVIQLVIGALFFFKAKYFAKLVK